MARNEKNGTDKIVLAEIETIEEVDFLLVSQLTVWFVLSGYLKIIRNGSDVLIRTGDIFILNKGDMVRIFGKGENSTLMVKFLTNEYQEEFPSFKLNMPLSMVYKKDGYELIKNCIASLYVEMIYPADGSDYMIEGYSKRLIGLLYRYLGPADEKEQTRAVSSKVKEIVSYINVNYAEKLSLDELAEWFYSSKYYLAHSFKKQLGISIGNYIKEVRLFHSLRMLENTNDKIVTIALSNGFPNVRAFNEAFKMRYKLTPADFREMRLKETVRNRADEVVSQDILALLSPYVPLDELSTSSPTTSERIEVLLDMQKTIGRSSKLSHVLKVKGDLIDSRLLEVRQRLEVKWVAVTRILKKVDFQLNDGKLVCSFRELDRVLHQILSAGMLPYLQFQFIDFDDWEDKGFRDNERFQEVFTELNVHLQQNFKTSKDWIYEFRCFYEFQNGGELCLPLVNIISIFKGYKNVVIHFPIPPEAAVSLEMDSRNTVYCIDDLTYMRKISLQAALDHLFDKAYIQIISENTNMKMLNGVLHQMQVFEMDEHLQTYSDLAQANASIWQYINLMNQNEAAEHYFPPLSLDSAKLFEYFPEELANKLSLCTSDGRYKENWYATEFVCRLFDERVYQNDACIVTKQQGNYRILAVYPEEKLLLFINRKNKEESESAWKKAKSPYLYVKMDMTNLEGTYRLLKQQLTPALIDQRRDIAELRECQKLSFEDIAYWNAINRPSRNVETLKIKGNYTLEFEVPLFGIVMIDLEKIND